MVGVDSPGGLTGAVLAGAGVAHPPLVTQDELWQGYFSTRYSGIHRALAERIFRNSGITTRHGAISPMVEDVSGWSTARRMQRYLVEALPLGKAAVADALAAARLDPADVGLFAACSCTGYATPGLDVLLARDLGLAAATQRLFLGHMGCYAALPGLGAVADFVRARGRPAVLLCLELTSLHVQPAGADTQQIVAHALFSDAAAAVVLRPDAGTVAAPHSGDARTSGPVTGGGVPGYEVLEVASVTDVATAEYMTWEVTDLGFRMGLSPRVPDVLDTVVAPLVHRLLDGYGLAVGDVDGWAVHPGGPRILDVVQARLGLPDAALAASRAVLARHGNCSSPTVLMIIEELLPARPQYVVALAFGPGLTSYAILLRRSTAGGL